MNLEMGRCFYSIYFGLYTTCRWTLVWNFMYSYYNLIIMDTLYPNYVLGFVRSPDVVVFLFFVVFLSSPLLVLALHLS